MRGPPSTTSDSEGPVYDSQARYQDFLRLSSEGIWRFDLERPIPIDADEDVQISLMFRYAFLAECNDAMARMYGYNAAAELVGKRLAEFHAESDPHSLEFLRHFIRNGFRLENAESQETDRSGNTKVFMNSFVGVIRDGNLIAAWGTQRDVTDQRRIENDHVQLAAMVRFSREAIMRVDIDGNIIAWNVGAEALFGYRADEIVGHPISVLGTGEEPDQPGSILARLRKGESISGLDVVRRRKDGSLLDVSLSVDPVVDPGGSIIGFTGVLRDITQRKRDQLRIEASEQRLRLGLRAGNIGTWDWDVRTNAVIWSEQLYQFHGLELDEFGGTSEDFVKLIHPEDAERVAASIRLAMANGTSYETEFRIVRPSGEVRWLSTQGQVVYEDGQPVRMLGATIDVTDRKRAEAALRETERRLRTAESAADVGLWELDMLTGEAFWSDGLWRLLGLTPDDEPTNIVRWQNHVHPDDAVRVTEAFAREVALKSEHFYFEFRLVRGDGSIRWVNSRGQIAYDAAGLPFRAYGGNQDITQRKSAEEALQQLATRFEQQSRLFEQIATTTPDFIYVFGLDGRFLYANRRLLEVWGRSYEDAIGKSLEELGYPQWHADMHMRELRQVIRTRQAIKGEVPFTGGSGISGIYEYIFTPVIGPDGEVEVIAGTTRDVTERERLLASERAARSDAEQASRMKDEFLATLSHELRTPLHAILGWSQIMVRGKRNPEEMLEGFQIIDRNARAQSQIIDDLLDMSRIISGKVRIDLHPIDLVSVLNSAVHTVRPTAEAKGVRLVFDLLELPSWLSVSGDSGRLQQVFWNILSNAVKFTPRSGHVRVSADHAKDGVTIRVSDDGEGIRPDFLPYVFDRFRQADASSTRRHGGLGLGLAIVKQIVELHGGTVRAESGGPGRGSTFTVSLPASGTPQFQQASRHVAHHGSTEMARGQAGPQEALPRLDGCRVLVVDDEADARILVQRILEGVGAQVHTADSAAAAFGFLILNKVDVLISDIGMPGEDGYTLLQRLRSLLRERQAVIPAIALSAYARGDDKVRAAESGFQIHLAKPAQPSELVQAVKSLANNANRGE